MLNPKCDHFVKQEYFVFTC